MQSLGAIVQIAQRRADRDVGEVVLSAGGKMWRLRAALRDIAEEKLVDGERMTFLDFLVLFYLHHSVDRESGCTQASHAECSFAIGCKVRAVERSTARLAKFGHIQIERKRIGHRRDGSQVFGASGGKNRYRLILERPSEGTVSSQDERPSVETASLQERPSVETVIKDRPQGRERPSLGTRKTVPRDGVSLSLNSLSQKISLAHARARVRARAHTPTRTPASGTALGGR